MKMTGPPAHRVWLASLLVVTSIAGGLRPSLLFGQLRMTLKANDFGICRTMVFSPDGKTLAVSSIGAKYQWKLWDTRSGKLRWAQDVSPQGLLFTGAPEVPPAFSPDSKTIAHFADMTTPFDRSKIVLRDVATGVSMWTAKTEGPAACSSHSCLTFLPDGKSLARAGQSEAFDGVVTMLSAETGQEHGKLTDTKYHFCLLTFSPDGKTMATANTDRIRRHPDGAGVGIGREKATITLWDVATRKQRAVLTCPDTPNILSLAFSPDGEMLASNEWVAVTVWDTEKGRVKWRFRPRGRPRWKIGPSMAFTASGDTLVLCTQAPFGIGLFDLKTGKPKWTVRTPSHTERRGSNPLTNCVVTGVSPSGRMAACETTSPGAEGRLRGTRSSSGSMSVSTTDSSSSKVWLWDTHTGRELATLPCPTVAVDLLSGGLTFSPDDKYLAGAHYDGTVSLWNIDKLAPKAPSEPQRYAAPRRKNREKTKLRTWTSANGKFAVEAALVQIAADAVTLKKRDGRTIQVPIEKLSSKDQDFVGGR